MKKYLIYLAVILIAGGIFYKKIYIPKHTFETIKVTKGNIEVSVNGIGNVGAKHIYKVGSTYGGKITEFNLTEGDKVTKGQIIAIVDSVDLKDKLQELKNTILKLQNDIKSLEIQKESAIIEAKYQEEVYKKNEKLFKKHAISELEYKKYLTSKNTAYLQIQNLQAKIDSLKNQIKITQASIKGIEERLKRYIIVSPIDGIVTKTLVSNYQTLNPNQALIEVVNPNDVWIKTYIDTRISGDVKVGNNAIVKLRSSNTKYQAKVVAINPNNNPITYEREIDVKLNNLLIPFYINEQAKVKISVKELKNIVKIPLKAISFYKQKDGVWILKGNKAYFKPIKIIAHADKFVATKDLDENSVIIIPNPSKKSLSDGMKIYHD